MNTYVIGFPRIGDDRQLKKASEAFFAGKASEDELRAVAKSIRAEAWNAQKDRGISFIPSGDFSFYDNVLDAAVMLGAVPERYKALGLSPLETYFAMARGYQGPKGDVKALPMKKWFNTNYHYIVPELGDGDVISADPSRYVAEFEEAKAQGVVTVPSLIGPYTFLRLARYVGEKCRHCFAGDVANAYAAVIEALAKAGAGRVALAEPALVLDTDADDLSLFTKVYSLVLTASRKAGAKVALQTYFGDIRDSWDAVMSAGFDAIGLDFFEGRERNLACLREKGFADGATLLAGVVCGKNIWRTDYAAANETISAICSTVPHDRVAIGASCSLLHVPWTVKSEKTLPQDVLKHFAFAIEKLDELKDLGDLADGGASAAFDANHALFGGVRVKADEKVRSAVAALTNADFERKPAFAEREAIQRKRFALPKFPTTTIGSFPQTKEVRAKRAALRKGEITPAQYEEYVKAKIAECVRLQEDIGLDILVHGEYERNDMVEYFGDHLDGFVFTDKAWVQSYGTRCVKPPIVWGDISRREPITVKWSVYAQSLTKKPMKGMLTGPVTILNWSFPREDIPLRDQTLQIALAIRAEVLDLEAAGIPVIQIDEAALREKLPLRREDWRPKYLDWAIPAFRLVHSGVRPETQIHTHMCYSEFGDIIRDIDAMDADVITFEASRADLKVLDDLKAADFRTEVGPGVYDIHSPRVPSVEEIVAAVGKMAAKVGTEKLWINPDCGLKTRGEPETEASLRNLVAAARKLRLS